MKPEIEFMKYKTRGAYHWEQTSRHLIKSNAFVKARYQKCIDLLKQELPDLKEKKILDLGCGDGVLAYKIFQEGALGYGIDPSEIAIKFAQEQHEKRSSNVVFYCRSGYDTGFEDDAFDAVICSDVIEHVQNPLLLLKEIKRILKSGGIAIISTPIKFTEKPLDKMHIVEWFPSEFQDLVKQLFDESIYTVSHPLFWFEFLSLSRICRILINLMSIWKNPFLSDSYRWKFFSLQYAVIKKG